MENEVPVKSIPANLEAERAVLGSLLIDPDAIIKVANFLRVEDFFRERHGWLYDVMLTLHERREPLDFVTVVDELERRGQLEEIGGPAYITDLIGGTPTSINIDFYARIVERTALLRRLISAAGQIAELAYDESQEVGEVIDRAETLIFGVSEARIHRDLMPIRAIMGNVVDRIDFLTRNKDTLMGVPTGFTMLDRLLGGMQKSDLIILAARPAMGKCVTEDTLLVDPDTGERHTIADLVAQRSARLLTLDESYRLRAGSACDFIDDGIKPVYRVVTALGREVKVTLSHPFLTIDGWQPLHQLRVGDRIGVPRHLPVFGSEEPADAEVKTLAYLLADGCVTATCPQFTNNNERLRDDFALAVAHFPGTRVRTETSHGTRTPTVCVASDAVFVRKQRLYFAKYLRNQVLQQRGAAAKLAKAVGVSPASITHWSQGKSVPSPEKLGALAMILDVPLRTLAPAGPATISQNAPNSLRVWLEEIGVWGMSAGEKFVPEFVFRVTRPMAALFLNRLFACDGSIYVLSTGQAGLSYSTVSKKLAQDVQHLLLRFGILAKLRTRSIKYGTTQRSAYELRVVDAASIERFCLEIGAFGKEDKIAAVLEKLAKGKWQTNLDAIPVEAWQAVRIAKGDLSWRSMFAAMGLPESSNMHVDKRAFGRERMSRIADALQARDLKNLAEGDLYWDTVTAIEYVGEQQVYDLTVDGTHNFVADDILVHNTSLAINVAQNAAKRYNARVAIFSLEMSNEQLAQRLLSMETGIDSHRLRLGQLHEDEWPILLEAANVLAGTSIFIDDTPAASVNEIRTKCRRLYAEHGLDMVLIDYMQLMSGQTGARNENRQQEISYISRSLKSLARELNVPVIALSQLSRAVESRSDKRPMLSDLRESGCLAGETLVYLPTEGVSVPIAELVNRIDTTVLSLDTETWQQAPSAVTNAFCTGVKPVFRLETQLGRCVRATANHRFLTIDGWKRLDELAAGELIAVPRILTGPDNKSLSCEQLALLGHLIGDGCVLPRHAVQYTTREQDLAENVAQYARCVFGTRVNPRISCERSWLQVYLASTERLTHNTRNPVAEWFTELGIFGLRSYEKRVPEVVFRQGNAGIATFLRHLWATDGCVRMTWGKSPRPAIYYASSSKQLAADVQHLLLRLSVNARVRPVNQMHGRVQWHVIVSGQDDVLRFASVVGAAGRYRAQSLEEILAYLDGRTTNTNRDVIPAKVWRMYAVPAMQHEHITTRQMQAGIGMNYCGTSLYQQNLGRERALRLAQVVRSPELERLANSDVYWDAVVSITADGEAPVYDLTVPGYHSFVAGNIVVHNSIEQDADVVLFIYRDDYYNEDSEQQNIADVIVAKHRHGSTGTVSLYFRKELTQFRDLEIQRTELDY